jgi:lipopolysaccharide/colanic/teichoic acid biosynthesis glycosyltransferase
VTELGERAEVAVALHLEPVHRPVSVSGTRAVRVMDVVLLVVLALPAAVAMAVIALCVKLESSGPVLYQAERVGQHGRLFRMFKFRKMHRDAVGAALTGVHDARFTRIGRFLARTKLDELPQLLNIARGDMRFVGPRPESVDFVSHYPRQFDTVLTVPPGMTGPSQLRYFREYVLLADASDEHYIEELLPAKLATDTRYVASRTVLRDFAFLLKTVGVMAHQLLAMTWRVVSRRAPSRRRARDRITF